MSRGLKLDTLEGSHTRPTADRVKEALFDILAPRLPGCRFADLFSGSGSVGCEALSRGAAGAVFVEQAPACIRIITRNLAKMQQTQNAQVLCRPVQAAIPALPLQDIVFLDPPYHQGLGILGLELIANYAILDRNGLAVLEHDRTEDIPPRIGTLCRCDSRTYGRVSLSFFQKEGSGAR